MRPLTFASPAAYHRTALGLLAGAAVAAGLAWFLPPPAAAVLPLAGALAGAAAVLGRPRGMAPMALAGAAAAALPLALPDHEAFALVAGGAIAGLALHVLRRRTASDLERPGPRGAAATAGAGALAILLGARAVTALGEAGVGAELLPGPLAGAALGACLAVFVALAAAATHVIVDPDPVERAHAELAPALAPELRSLASRALEAHRAARRLLSAGTTQTHARIAERIGTAASVTLRLLARCQELDDELAVRAGSAPAARREELRVLADGTSDEGARRHYALALRLQEEQHAADGTIRRDRERVLAALHAHLALLERARLALLGLASARALESAASSSRMMDPLEDLAQELEAHGAALAEASAAVPARG